MEKQNITSEEPQIPETIEVESNIGACFVVDDNPENTDGGCDVASDSSSGSGGTIVDQEMYSTSENDSPEDRITCVMSDYKPGDDIKGEDLAVLTEKGSDLAKELKDSADGSVAAGGTSDDRYVASKLTCTIPLKRRDGRFRNTSPTDLDKNLSGYEGDVDYGKDGESSGNVTDSDTETKKTLAEKSKHIIEKAIERLDAIKEDLAEVDEEKKLMPDDEDESYEEDIDDEPGSSCEDTMVSEYNSTDIEGDTGIPRHVLYKLLNRQDKPRPEKRKGSKNTKRKLSTEDA